ncbi:hypothetical protein JW898_05545 [Candidatus Woesearchaeota archaeon]|nr:hypothetical protein [Candidatus Woesearchaeota archaeon]
MGGSSNGGSEGDRDKDTISSHETPQGISAVREQIFQSRVPYLEQLGMAYALSQNNLFILAGPTGAGKSIVEMMVTHQINGELFSIRKDQTRQQRTVGDDDRRTISKSEFKRRRDDSKYLYSYVTKYSNESGEPEKVFYGIPRAEALDKTIRGDALLTLTDPGSYGGFFDEEVVSQLKGLANVIPVVITTDTPEDLTLRLEGRICGEEERQRRLKQVEPQWEYYRELCAAGEAQHILVNNTPQLLREAIKQLTPEGKIPPKAEGATYRTIDDTIRKFAGIVNFYKHIRQNQHMVSRNNFDVHDTFLNWVTGHFFGVMYSEMMQSLKAGQHVKLKSSAELVNRIKQETRNSAQVDHIFDHLAVQDFAIAEDGTLTFKFNDVIRSSNVVEEGKKIFEGILPRYGWWVNDGGRTCGTRRYALTDRPSWDQRSNLYAIDMKLV